MKLLLLHEATEHTCQPEEKQPGESWAAWGNRKKNCPGCEAEAEAELEAGFIGDPDEPPPVEKPGEVEERTGETLEFDENKPMVMQILDILQSMGGEKWNRRGPWRERYGKRIRKKDKCTYGHTCEDPQNPLPTFGRGVGKKIFSPVTGAPKEEYRDYYLSKNRCPACTGEAGCDNPVSTEFGRPKPFCAEHVGESPYPKELGGRLEAGEEPDPSADYLERKKEWETTRATHLRPGDQVKKGKLRGHILEIDPSMEDRTHRVKWSNPKAEALRVTWVDPKTIDLDF